jgi:hypothetical protein
MLHRPVEVTGVKQTYCRYRIENNFCPSPECLLSSKAVIQITRKLQLRRSATGQ